ncbi:MAG: shikimate kinase [Nitrospinota bacterium]
MINSGRGFRNIALTGFKSSGKTRIGKMLAKKLNMDYLDIDTVIEKIYSRSGNARLRVRSIYKKYGADYFRRLEGEALKEAANKDSIVLSLGGGTPLNRGFKKAGFKGTRFVYLNVKPSMLYARIKQKGFPPFIDEKRPRASFDELLAKRTPVYEKIADVKVDNTDKKPMKCVKEIIEKLGANRGR